MEVAAKKDDVDEILNLKRVHRFNPAFIRAYDDRRQPPGHVIAAIQRYDRNLFARFNLVLGLWELWRWRGGTIPDRKGLPPEEFARRAVFVFKICHPATGAPIPFDMQVYRRLVVADNWAKGQLTADQVADGLDAEDALLERRKAAANEQFVEDWKTDNKHQVRSAIGLGRRISTPR
jgi:hypothetical protein